MTNGILFALLSYASFSWSDAGIKALGGQMSVFQIGFFLTLVSGGCILLTTPRAERQRDFWRMKRPWAVQARALSGLGSSLLSVVAFTTIPLAEVYALTFLAPLFVTILSVLVLKEHVGPWRWLAVFAGFAGVLLVVRPGFRELQLGHLAAFGIAFLAAITVILMRSLAREERRTTMLGYLIFYGLIVNGAGMIANGSFVMPTLPQAGMLALAGVFSAFGHIGLLQATRFAAANEIAPTNYSQIIWAVLIGLLFFQERPDLTAFIGLAVIVASGLLTFARERIRLGTVRWNPFGRNRL